MKSGNIFVAIFMVVLLFPISIYAQNTPSTRPFTERYEKAKVLEATDQTASSTNPTGRAPVPVLQLKTEILEGPNKGDIVTIGYVARSPLAAGDIFYARHVHNTISGIDTWSVATPYRLHILGGLAFIFIILVFLFGGMQGVRGLASLTGSIVLIFYILIPSIYHGYSALMISIGVSSLIIIAGSYVTHGFNKTTTAAVFGMIVTIIVTGLGTYYVVHAAHLSGYTSEEEMYLNLNTNGAINMVGLLLGGMMIGLLGVLYDIAIAQAVAVEELLHAGKHLTRGEIYRRALRIGREHIGALVNTLALLYVGASLPLLLLLQNATMGVLFILNGELFATEIIKILMGSIGLILGVPITTLIASLMLSQKDVREVTAQHRH